MTTPAAPAALAFSTLVWNVQVPRRINATKPGSNSLKSVVLQPLAEAIGCPSASPRVTASSRAVTLLEPELVRVRKAAAGADSCRPSGSSQAGPAALAPRNRGTRIPQSERDSLLPSIYPPHTPQN